MQNTKTIANAGGYAIFEKDNKWFFVNYGTFWLYTAAYLLVLTAVFSIVISIISFVQISTRSGTLLVGLSVLSFIGLYFVLKLIKAPRKKNFTDHKMIAIIDFNSKNLLDGDKKILAPLKDVKLTKTWQLFVSSWAIKARWSTGSLIIARGNPFTGGSPEFGYPLKKRGLMK